MANYLSLRGRLSVLIVNSLIAYGIFIISTGLWWPTGGGETVWFLSALSFWFLSLLSAPWFIPPRDALISAVGAVLLLATIQVERSSELIDSILVLKHIFIGYSVVVIFSAVSALFLFDKNEENRLARLSFRITGNFGAGEALFSGPAIVSIVGFYAGSPAEVAWLMVFWMTIVIIKPIDYLYIAIRDFLIAESRSNVNIIGSVSRIDHPNIVRVKLDSNAGWDKNRLFTVCMPDGGKRYVLSLFTQVQGGEIMGTGLCVASVQEDVGMPVGAVCSSHDDEKTKQFLENLSGTRDARLVGFVVEGSNIGIVAFEFASTAGLSEGDVVFIHLPAGDVFYQIIGAETLEESFDQNPRGTYVVRAAQLGVYSSDQGFTKYRWLPEMNTPVFSAASREFERAIIGDKEFIIGDVPSTNVGVVASLDNLVEYHTAILGVTGTGKTELALDVVRFACQAGTKVFCVDFTGDYRERLSDISPIFPNPDKEKAEKIERLLAYIESYGFDAKKEKAEVRKLLDEIRKETECLIKDFLISGDSNLAIFELPEISNSKVGLRLTEIYLSSIMNWAKGHRKARKVLICLEEAHTIVPESFGSGFDGETKWVVERIGQIALQGRKYGVGLLIITQRTALVSKTILSQCNTFLTHCLIDQTSLNFLDSVYSSQHTKLIPNLGRFEFIAFGKGVRAERPIILKKEFDQQKLDESQKLNVRLPFEENAADDADAGERIPPKITPV